MFREALGRASIYSLFARAIGARRGRTLYVERYIRAAAGSRVLDIGCGPADILEALPDVDYHGFDMEARYIAAARERFGGRGVFEVAKVGEEELTRYSEFDLVLATGVLHHLDDAEAQKLFELASSALRPGGTLVTLDGCFVEHQSIVARGLIASDRGRYVRRPPDYLRLAKRTFHDVESHLCHDLLRVPYTHWVMRCSKPCPDDASATPR